MTGSPSKVQRTEADNKDEYSTCTTDKEALLCLSQSGFEKHGIPNNFQDHILLSTPFWITHFPNIIFQQMLTEINIRYSYIPDEYMRAYTLDKQCTDILQSFSNLWELKFAKPDICGRGWKSLTAEEANQFVKASLMSQNCDYASRTFHLLKPANKKGNNQMPRAASQMATVPFDDGVCRLPMEQVKISAVSVDCEDNLMSELEVFLRELDHPFEETGNDVPVGIPIKLDHRTLSSQETSSSLLGKALPAKDLEVDPAIGNNLLNSAVGRNGLVDQSTADFARSHSSLDYEQAMDILENAFVPSFNPDWDFLANDLS